MTTLNLSKYQETKDLLGEKFAEFLSLFISELEIAVHTMSSASADITLIAHSQKSTCALIGAVALSEKFQQIKLSSTDGKDVSSDINALSALVDALKIELNSL